MEEKSCVNNQWEVFLFKTIVLWFSATCQFHEWFFTTQPFFTKVLVIEFWFVVLIEKFFRCDAAIFFGFAKIQFSHDL